MVELAWSVGIAGSTEPRAYELKCARSNSRIGCSCMVVCRGQAPPPHLSASGLGRRAAHRVSSRAEPSRVGQYSGQRGGESTRRRSPRTRARRHSEAATLGTDSCLSCLERVISARARLVPSVVRKGRQPEDRPIYSRRDCTRTDYAYDTYTHAYESVTQARERRTRVREPKASRISSHLVVYHRRSPKDTRCEPSAQLAASSARISRGSPLSSSANTTLVRCEPAPWEIRRKSKDSARTRSALVRRRDTRPPRVSGVSSTFPSLTPSPVVSNTRTVGAIPCDDSTNRP